MKTNIDAVKAKVAKAQEQLEAKLAELQTSDDCYAQLLTMRSIVPVPIGVAEVCSA